MRFANRFPLVIFFGLAYALSWLVWGVNIAHADGLTPLHLPALLAFVGLAAAAYGAAALSDGRAALLDLLGRLVRWRAHPFWYAVALLLALAAVALHLLLNGEHNLGLDLSAGAALLSLLTNFPLMWLTEETAWRGFAMPRILRSQSALVASLELGLLWGLWHIPLFFTPGSFQSRLPFVGFILSAIATTVLATWIFNHTHGSVLIAALFHAAVDASIVYTGVMSGDARLFWLFVAVQWAAAALITWLEGPETLAGERADRRALNDLLYLPSRSHE